MTDFQNIVKITTSVLQIHTFEKQQKCDKDTKRTNIHKVKEQVSDEKNTNLCLCNEMKALLKITVKGNSDDLVITCNGVNTVDSIADLVDGYCRIVNNTEISFWDRSHAHTKDALEKPIPQIMAQKDLPKHFEQSSQLPNFDSKNDKCKLLI